MRHSRRRFLRSTLSAPLAAALGQGRVRLLEAALQNQTEFENPYLIRYDSNCFTINDRDAFIFSAAFHYPRCPQELWRDRLTKLNRAGFNTIESYVFWNYHEPEEGRVNLRAFEDFIQEVKQKGFWMIVRPGPYVCAEWDVGGFPHWVIAKRFPLRSNHPASIETSQHWFNQVLPVIQRNQVTVGGPIIMVQVENEYDYWPGVPEADKREYIRALARMAWNAGIEVPLITCWTKPARQNSDRDMARVMDTCNFYPRWNIVGEVLPALQALREEEPATPLGVTELQGGWFSEIGGRLSVDQEGVSAAQLNMLSKTVIEQGATYFNYYMGFGGTNFDWAAKNLTTTYDYAAPIREPGGLWEKYYAARVIGSFLSFFGGVLARAKLITEGVGSTQPAVSVTERENGRSGVVFVRENANAQQRFKMTFRDPFSPTHRIISVPREGELVMGPRGMKMLPVGAPITGSTLRYSTAEVLAHGLLLDRDFLIVYDEPGRLVEISFPAVTEPHVEGDTVYQYWDSDYESVVIGLQVEKTEKILLVNGFLLVVALPRELALRTWVAEFPTAVVPGAEGAKPMSVSFISDSSGLADTGWRRNRIWAELEFAAGEHDLIVLLPPLPAKCRVDGVLTEFRYERERRATRVPIANPALPAQTLALNEVQVWIEKVSDESVGEWLNTPLRALEDLGPIPYGYVKYHPERSSYRGERRMFISTFADDFKKVFINGKLAPEASNSKREVQIDLAGYARDGIQSLEICYELFGSPNFGRNIAELKGVESVRWGTAPEGATEIGPWRIQRFPAAMRGRELDPTFSVGGWTPMTLSEARSSGDLVPAFTWCRADFRLEKPPEGWTIPWKVTFEAGRDALLYLNGRFIGRYVTTGPQKDFYLPEPYLTFDRKQKNMLTVVLAYADAPQFIHTLSISPYQEFATFRNQVEFEW